MPVFIDNFSVSFYFLLAHQQYMGFWLGAFRIVGQVLQVCKGFVPLYPWQPCE